MKEFLKKETKVKNYQILLEDVGNVCLIAIITYLMLVSEDAKMMIEVFQEIAEKGNGVALEIVVMFFAILLPFVLALRLGTMMMFQSPESNKSKKKSKNRK